MKKIEMLEQIDKLTKELKQANTLRGYSDNKLKGAQAEVSSMHLLLDGIEGVTERKVKSSDGWGEVEVPLTTRFSSFLQTLIPSIHRKEKE